MSEGFNIIAERWETTAPPPLGNCNWCGVATNDALYIIGRYDGNYGDEVQKFTPIHGGPIGSWEQVANYPTAMCGIAAAPPWIRRTSPGWPIWSSI